MPRSSLSPSIGPTSRSSTSGSESWSSLVIFSGFFAEAQANPPEEGYEVGSPCCVKAHVLWEPAGFWWGLWAAGDHCGRLPDRGTPSGGRLRCGRLRRCIACGSDGVVSDWSRKRARRDGGLWLLGSLRKDVDRGTGTLMSRGCFLFQPWLRTGLGLQPAFRNSGGSAYLGRLCSLPGQGDQGVSL